MGKETLSYEDTMDRLYQVRETAAGIAQVLDQQTQVAAQFRTCISEQERERQKGMEQAHADAGILNKWKYLFYVLVIAYTLMRVAVLMIRRDPVGAVEEVIRNGVLLGVLHIFWDRRSKIAVVIKAVFMLGFTYDILQFFAISLEDLRKGVLWSPILSAAVFAAAAAAILRLIRWQNARIDRTNEEIRRRNQQIDQQTDAQNRQIILRNQELTRQYNQLDLQLKRLRGQLSQLTSGGWYPKNQGTDGYFYSVQGIQDLIDALEGPRANSMQEALDYIGTRDYRAQSLAYQEAILRSNSQIAINQQELARNQRFANLLTCGQILLQVQQNAAIHRMEQQQRDFYRTRQR